MIVQHPMLWCAACLMAGIAIGLEPVLADL